jgi:hypothetical protein
MLPNRQIRDTELDGLPAQHHVEHLKGLGVGDGLAEYPALVHGEVLHPVLAAAWSGIVADYAPHIGISLI